MIDYDTDPLYHLASNGEYYKIDVDKIMLDFEDIQSDDDDDEILGWYEESPIESWQDFLLSKSLEVEDFLIV